MKKALWSSLFLFFVVLGVLSGGFAFAEGRISPEGYVEGEALVVLGYDTGRGVFTPESLARGAGMDYLDSVARGAGATVSRTYKARYVQARGKVFALVKSDTKTTTELIAELKKDPRVIAASPNRIVHLYGARGVTHPDDTYYEAGALWGMTRIRANEAWDITTGDPNGYVAVMDTGIYADHPDLAGNVARELCADFTDDRERGYDDRHGHGTHVAGTIGAVGNNGVGVVGVNWRTKIIALKVLSGGGKDSYAAIVDAVMHLIDLLDDGYRIPAVNMSFGGWGPTPPWGTEEDAEWQAYKELSDQNKTVIVVAAGNESHEVGAPAPTDFVNQEGQVEKGSYCYPASYTSIDNMIVVGATAKDNAAAPYSNWSAKFVDIVAPGGNTTIRPNAYGILSTVPPYEATKDDGTTTTLYYNAYQGTSMATPHVTGAVALLAAKHPDWSAAKLKEVLLATANRDVNPVTYDQWNIKGEKMSRCGLLDVKAALDYVDTPVTPKSSSSGGCNAGLPLAVVLFFGLGCVLRLRSAHD